MKAVGVSMKIGMKYWQLDNESSGGRYENQNEIAQGIIWEITMKTVGVTMKIRMKYWQLDNEKSQWK